MTTNMLHESSAEVAAHGKHFCAKVLTFCRSQVSVILKAWILRGFRILEQGSRRM